jgi:hypothetical protein
MRAYPLGGIPSLSQPNKTHPRALVSSRMEKKDFRVDAKKKKKTGPVGFPRKTNLFRFFL